MRMRMRRSSRVMGAYCNTGNVAVTGIKSRLKFNGDIFSFLYLSLAQFFPSSLYFSPDIHVEHFSFAFRRSLVQISACRLPELFLWGSSVTPG
jgi:hypothetical protein